MSVTGASFRCALAVSLLVLLPAAASAAILTVDLSASMDSPYAPAGGSHPFVADGSDRSHAGSHRDDSHSFRLSDLQTVSVEGADYYAFLLDARDAAPGHVKHHTLDGLRLYVAARGDIESLEEVATDGTFGWEMPGGNDAGWLWSNGGAGPDNGEARRQILIARRAFEGIDPGDYLYLYSRFGTASDGPRGWDRRNDAFTGLDGWHAVEASPLVAEPPTLLLIGAGLLAATSAGRRRKH